MKKFITLMIWTLFFAFPCMAKAESAMISDFDNTASAVITGYASSDEQISISIFGKGMTASDADNMVENALIYVNMIEPRKDDYSFSAPIDFTDRETGEYSIAVYQKGVKLLDDSFYFAKADDSKTAINTLNTVISSGSSTEINDFISQNKIALEFKSQYDGKVSVSEIVKILSTCAPFDEDDMVKCAYEYKKSMIIGAISSGVITDIRTVEDQIDTLNCTPVSEVYGASYMTDSAKLAIASKLKSFAPYESIKQFDEKLYEAIVLSITKYPTGAGDIKEAIQKLYPKFPASLLTASICRSVAYNDYKSLDELMNAMEKFANSASDKSNGGSAGSGGGSSSGGKTSSNNGGTPFVVSSNHVSESTETTDVFSDIDKVLWAKDAIIYLSEKGIVSGMEDNKFYPELNIKREEFLKMLVIMFSIPSDNSDKTYFSDVPNNAWYTTYVNAAYAAKIVDGRPDGSFGIGDNISRQDAAVMLCRCMNDIDIEESDEIDFTDLNDISDYAADAVKKIKSFGIISGYDDKTFRPRNYITRAEAAKILYEADERIKK